MGEAKVSTASLPLSEVYNPDVSEGSSAEEGKIRRAPISQVKRKHTPHVVTEAIVNDHLRPTLPEVSRNNIIISTYHVVTPAGVSLLLSYHTFYFLFGGVYIVGSIKISVSLNDSS